MRRDAEEAMKPLGKELRRRARDVEALQGTLREAARARGDRVSAQVCA